MFSAIASVDRLVPCVALLLSFEFEDIERAKRRIPKNIYAVWRSKHRLWDHCVEDSSFDRCAVLHLNEDPVAAGGGKAVRNSTVFEVGLSDELLSMFIPAGIEAAPLP